MRVPKHPPIRDRKYLDYLREQPCFITGIRGAVDPAHIGTAGKGIKSGDDEALPLQHAIHLMCHQYGEMSVLRERIPVDVFRAALRAYARERYQAYLDENRSAA